MTLSSSAFLALTGALVSFTAACGDDGGVSSDEEARRAYFGLDTSIQKSLDLGFMGFDAASSANIPPQMTTGTAAGTLAISGQVDQGNSSNKQMRLAVGMVGYSDGKIVIDDKTLDISITYDTDADPTMQPALDLSLKNIPTGTIDGTLVGTYHMSGDLDGDATLNLTMTGTMMDSGGGHVVRAPNATHVTGTVTNASNGVYHVDVMF